MTAARELLGLWVVRLGKRIVWLGDELAGWGHASGYELGLRHGRRFERGDSDE